MEFRKDGVLWGVEELAPITAAGHYQAAFRLPQLPAGEYQVTLGIEGMEVSCPECVVTVTKQSDIKPLSNGAYYSKKSGETHFWYVNQNGAMIWDGEPFIPMGGMFCPDFVTEYDPEDVALNLANWQEAVDVLDQLEEHGIYDLYINANSDTVGDRAAWQYLVDYLDERGFRYGIQINTSNADYNGYYVTANVNAITATVAADTTTATKSVTHKYLGRADVVSGAYFVTVGSEVIARGIAQVTKTDTHFSFSASGLPVTGSAKKIYFLPYAEGATTTAPNFYEYREENEEKLQNFFEQMKFGDGMRFVVDPTYNETTYANWTEGFRPYYMEYNKGLSDWLEEKYQTMDALNRAWCVSPKIESFWEAAHLIPVSTIEEKTWLYNVENYQIYEYDNVSGCMWDDNIFYREKGLRDFHMDVADLIKESCQIPVIYKNVAYYNAFFVNDRGDSGHDGIGNEAYGDFSRIARLQGAVNGMCNESAKTMWNVVTETNIEENMTLKTESGIISYPDKQTMYEHFNTLISAGSKGIYDFLFNNSNSWAKAYCYTEKPELFDWMSEYSSYINAEELAEQGVQAPQFYSYPATPAWWNQEGSGWHNKWTAVLYRKDITMPIHRVLDNGAILAGVDSLDNVSENIVVSIQNAPASLVYGKELQEN